MKLESYKLFIFQFMEGKENNLIVFVVNFGNK